jgi:short-subunit dehydrogenase
MRLDEASILITGASSGIGAALARRLAAKGARLTLTARREVRLQRVAMQIVHRYPGAAPRVVPADVVDPAQARRLVDEAVAAWGGLHVLINNAGISAYGRGDRLPAADLRGIMETNFYAPVRLTLATLPHFRDRGRGAVVNVASLAALYGVPFLGAYGASKAALVNFSQSLRAELHGTGIRILVAYPNYTDTELFGKELRTGNERRPAGNYASAEAVASAIVHALEEDREELVLTLAGKAMHRVRGIAPSLLDKVMAGMASRLRGRRVPAEAEALS